MGTAEDQSTTAGGRYSVDHIHLISPAIHDCKDWYCRNLGGTVTFEGTFKGNKVFYVDLNGFTLIIIENLPAGKPLPPTLQTRQGLDHFGLRVTDLEAAEKDLKSRGVRFLTDPMQVRPGLRIAYIEGPDMVRIELSERTPVGPAA